MKEPLELKSLSRFRHGLLANFAGTGWSAIVQVVSIPLYIKFLGIEAFGLIGFYLLLQAMLQVLDLGLSPTINREMARYSVHPEKAAEARDLVRTLEAGYWLIGIAIGALILAAAPLIAADWIKASAIPVHNVRHAVMLMGVLAVFQWPVSLYQGGLMGLGRQVLYNSLNILFVTLANGGAVLILWLVSSTIQAFFLWLVAASAAKAILLSVFLWKSLPLATRPSQFDLHQVRNVWRFAVGMTGITASALILTQLDKVIVSRLLDLKTFGYYALAGMFGSGLSMIVASVFNTIFPRFSALVAAHDEEALKRLYHRCTQLMAVLVLPLAAVLALFSTDILQFWTKNAELARDAGPVATLLVIGSALNGLMNLPYALQLAYGWTGVGLRINLFLTVTLVPSVWILTSHYGAIGAASAWAGLNCIYIAIGVPLTHRRLLRGEMGRWLVEDVGLSLTAVLLVAGLGRALITQPTSAGMATVNFSVVFFGALIAAAFAAPQIRSRLLTELSRIRLGYT